MASAAIVLMPGAAWALTELAMDLATWATQPGAGVDAILAPALVGLGAIVCAYLALSALLMIAAALGGSLPAWTAAVAPAAWRRVIATATGITLSAGLAAPAFAADIAPGLTAAVATAGVDVTPGWAATATDARPVGATDALPGWIDGPGSTDDQASADVQVSAGVQEQGEPASDGPQTDTVDESTYVVHPGDSLWGITSQLLADQDPALIAAAWPLLYRANRDVIGDDPSLIRPGQVLHIPEELAR